MKRGFTLMELMAVIAIIGIVIAASIGGYSKITRRSDEMRAQELVNQVATALATMFQKEGVWPRRLLSAGSSDGKLDQNVALVLAKGGYLSLSTDMSKYNSISRMAESTKLEGLDRFGVVTPWATEAIKRAGSSATTSTSVSGASGTVDDHTLHFALDLDGDGVVRGASVGGASVDVRATAIVWCCGKDGKIVAYDKGKGSNLYSWSYGQTKNVK